MSEKFDVIVIGAGHNGLTAATLAASQGKRVAIFEKADHVGGLAACHEFHKGFKAIGLFHSTRYVRPAIAKELQLADHGLKFRDEELPIFHPEANGPGVLLWHDPKRAEDELSRLGDKSTRGYQAYRDFLTRIRPFVAKFMDDEPVDLFDLRNAPLWDLGQKALSLRLLGKSDMMELLRLAPMAAADFLNEYVQHDLVKAILATASMSQSYTGPWSPATAANLLLEECLASSSVVGGSVKLMQALEACAREKGVEIKLGTVVEKVNIDKQGRATSLILSGGQSVTAQKILATCDPQTLFLDLIAPQHLTAVTQDRALNYRARGITAKINLAIKGEISWTSRPDKAFEYVVIGDTLNDMERAFDPVKYGQFSTRPMLEVYVPSYEVSELAPEGHHVVSILAHGIAYDSVKTAEERSALLESVFARIGEHAPALRTQVVASEVLAPKDIETRYGVKGGHRYHGEMVLDQILARPFPECAQYKTPFRGLYLCGSGSHPGGGLTCAPGYFGAKAALSS